MDKEDLHSVYNIEVMPKEVLEKMFKFLNPKSLTTCRAVCSRWQQIVDIMGTNENLWYKHCYTDYRNICHSAYMNAVPRLSWYRLYKSLTLWARLKHARTTINHFVIASFNYLIYIYTSFQVLRDGIIGVLTETGIDYYNLSTQVLLQELSIAGFFLMYRENEETILLLYRSGVLEIRRKENRNKIACTLRTVFYSVILENIIYYADFSNIIYKCNFINGRYIRRKLIKSPSRVLSFGYENNTLYILTSQFTICSYKDQDKNVWRTVPFADSSARGKCQALRKYNFTNQIEWGKLRKIILIDDHKHEYPFLEDLQIIRTHGPVMFVGYKRCILRIYYSLYTTDVIDLLTNEPLKEYTIFPHEHYTSKGPILNIDVVEGEDRHTLLVLLYNRMVTIKFSHFQNSAESPIFEDPITSDQVKSTSNEGELKERSSGC